MAWCALLMALAGIASAGAAGAGGLSAAGSALRVTASSDLPRKTDNGMPEPQDVVDLIGKDLGTHWKFFCADESVPIASVWKIIPADADVEQVLVCTGEPRGFLFTTEDYRDFELSLEWKFPTEANGNSGVLIYTQEEPRIWPTSMQIQFHQPKAGSVFPSGDAKSDNTTDVALARPVNMWNECRIVSRSGRITVEINGTMAGETTGSVPSSGRIALQSEGSEVHFRRMRLRKLESISP